MRVEHIGLNVKDPVAMKEWYCKHLGMKVIRGGGQCFFVSDETGHGIIEIYHNPAAPVLDFNSMNPLMFHLAFCSNDVAKDRERLIATGARPVGEVHKDESGLELAMLRGPWGLPIQLAKRPTPMV